MTSSANNSTNTPLIGRGTWTGLWESPADTIQGVQILINTNVAGTAYMQFSQDKTRVEYEHAYGVIGGIALYKIERRKARYVRVKYVNDASAQTLMLLHTTYLTDYEKEDLPITVDAEDSNILIFGELPTGGLQAIKLDASGNLKVSGISGGGVSSDVNITNTLLQVKDISAIEQMTIQTDRILYDTDIIANRLHDISGSVSISNAELSVRDASAIELLEQIADGITVDVGTVEVSGNVYDATRLTVVDASAIAVLENIYNATASTDINTTPIAYSPVHLDLETQGATAWADSSLAWSACLNSENGWLYENKTAGGANLYFYSNTALVAGGNEPDITLGSLMNMSFVGNYRLLLDSNPNKKFYLVLTTKPTGSGDAYPGVFHSRRVWELPSSTVVSKGADYMFYAMMDITSFHRDLDHKEMALAISNGDCAPEEIIQFMSINVDSGTPANQFSGIVKEAFFSTAGGTNRHVVFDNSLEKRATKKITELSVSDGNLLVSVNNPQTIVEISGSVITDLSGSSFTDAKLNVYDLSANEHLTAIEDILETGFVNVKDASANAVLDLLTFSSKDGLNALLVKVDNQLTTPFNVEVDNFPASQTVDISGVPIVEISGNVVVNDLSVNVLNSFLDVHCFGSSDGTTFHHLKTSATGELVSHSQTRDGEGNSVSSTDFGTYRALNVNVSNTTAVPVSASATQYGSYGNLCNNVASILPSGVSSGIDVSAWSYFVGAYEDYYSGTPTTGFLRLQYSFDNTTYYDLFNTTVSPSGVGTPRRANFQKQEIPAINWIRFKNDTNGTMPSVTITLVGASLS